MKLSYNWLNDYVDLKSIDIKDLINRLTLATCEVEEVTDAFPGIAQLIIARIVSCEKHPQADRLQICQVDAGKFQGKIVCGAPNARPGILVPFAPVGATLPGKDGKGMTIGKANIRGVESHGMLASAAEMGLDRIFAGEGLLELTDI
ncbi:MAG TPA: phenylalanine--tRNA ligase subunit beta, partial [Leptospiraceae bacterium]|nr:phenylalanine--tRNA ligase subunit beta [Leptospiraceae bacterium]